MKCRNPLGAPSRNLSQSLDTFLIMTPRSLCVALALASAAGRLEKDDDILDHVRRLSSYADGGTDMACWYNRAFVDCASQFPGVDLT